MPVTKQTLINSGIFGSSVKNVPNSKTSASLRLEAIKKGRGSFLLDAVCKIQAATILQIVTSDTYKSKEGQIIQQLLLERVATSTILNVQGTKADKKMKSGGGS